jgi:hypothetical protein
MLEGLNKIEWSKLTHAYVEASDVPNLLRQLASGAVEERESARHVLHGNIWHQGTDYEATACAIPFLIELLAAPTVTGKAELLIFLSLCANGNSYCEVHAPLYKDEVTTEEWRTQLAKELDWVKRTRSAVVAGRALYESLLSHVEANVREAAGFLLATLDQPSAETAVALWEQLTHESDERCRASLLIGFGCVANPTPENQGVLLTWFLKTQSKLERLAAALALAQVFPRELAREPAHEILNAIYDPEVVELMNASPWGVHGMELIIEGALLRLEGQAAAYVTNELEKALADGIHPVALNVTRALLSLAFREMLPKEATLEALTGFQQRVIRLMAINKHAWVKSVAGAPAREPQDAVVFRFRATDFGLERLCRDAAFAAGTFRQKPKTFFGTLQWWRTDASH